MRRVLKALVSGLPVGDVTTLEDKASIEEARQAYEEFKGIVTRWSHFRSILVRACRYFTERDA